MSFKSMSDKIYAACELILFAVTILTWIKRDFTGLIAFASLGAGIFLAVRLYRRLAVRP
jgi:small-conductance mechanosensitive channel